MKVLMLNTNEIVEYPEGYAARLIEQGRAVLPPLPPQKKAEKQSPAKSDKKKE